MYLTVDEGGTRWNGQLTRASVRWDANHLEFRADDSGDFLKKLMGPNPYADEDS